MPVFSNLLWPFNSNATPAASTHDDTSSVHKRLGEINLARNEGPAAHTMSAALDGVQADMEVTFGHGSNGNEVVDESVKEEQNVQQEPDVTHDADGVVDRGEHETSASGTVHATTGDKLDPGASQAGDPVEDGKDREQAQSQVPDKTTDPLFHNHGVDDAPQVKEVSGSEEQMIDRFLSERQVAGYPHIKAEQPHDVQMTHSSPADNILANMSNETPTGQQADHSTQHEHALPSSPLPSVPRRSEGQTYRSADNDEPPSEPSSDSVFMQQINAHFGGRDRASGSHAGRPDDTSNNLLKEAMEYYREVDGSRDSQNARPYPPRSASFPTSVRDVSGKKGLLRGNHDEQGLKEHADRLDNVRRGGVSHGPYDRAFFPVSTDPWSSQPRPMTQFPLPSQSLFHNMVPNLHGKQVFTPQLTPGAFHYPYAPAASPLTLGYQMSDRPVHQASRKDHPHTQIPTKRKYMEESDLEEEKDEVLDEYSPSESGDDEESDSDSDSDVPLMYRKKKVKASARLKREGSDSESEYQDEGGEDLGEESEDQDEDQREESNDANEEGKAARKEEMEIIQYMDVNPRSPTRGPVEDAAEPSVNLAIAPPLPSASPGPSAIQRTLPVLQPQPAPKALDPDEISFKLPQYHVEVMPLKTNDDCPEVRVNLPGMIREHLYLTPDHAHQEIHLLNHLFMPGQQSLAEPDPQPMVALLNFHTVATMVLEAYTAYEVGDLEIKTNSSSKKKEDEDEKEALDASKDEIFFAVMDRWRVGLTHEANRPSYKLIRGVQEFCDIALDVIYYLVEHGFVRGPQMMRAKRSDKVTKKDKDGGKHVKKAAAAEDSEDDSEDDDAGEGPTPKKKGRPSKAQNGSPVGTKGKVNTLQARKKAKTAPTPKGSAKAGTKKTPKKKEPTVSVVSRKKK